MFNKKLIPLIRRQKYNRLLSIHQKESEIIEFDVDKFIEPYLSKCDFNDECDTCGNPNGEQSWAMINYSDVVEVDRYLCQTCAIKFVKELKAENDAFASEMDNAQAP